MNRTIINFCILLFSIFLALPNSGFSSNNGEHILWNKSQNVKTYKNLSYTPTFNSNTAFKNGGKFPYSWGIGLEGLIFSQEYTAEILTLHNETISAYSDSITQHIIGREQQILVRPEIQILPFLTIYGLGGYAQGKITPDITAHRIILQLPFQDTIYELTLDTNVVINTPAKYNGTVYGIGTTITYVYQQFFVEADYNYSEIHLTDTDGKLRSHRFSPKAGMIFASKSNSNRGTVWIGASFLNNSQALSGKVNVRDVAGDLANYIGEEAYYEENLKPVNRWNMTVGGSWSINQHFNFALAVGFLQRKKISLGFLYRF